MNRSQQVLLNIQNRKGSAAQPRAHACLPPHTNRLFCEGAAKLRWFEAEVNPNFLALSFKTNSRPIQGFNLKIEIQICYKVTQKMYIILFISVGTGM